MKEFELNQSIDPLEIMLEVYYGKNQQSGVEILSCTVGAVCAAVIALGLYAYVAAAHTVVSRNNFTPQTTTPMNSP